MDVNEDESSVHSYPSWSSMDSSPPSPPLEITENVFGFNPIWNSRNQFSQFMVLTPNLKSFTNIPKRSTQKNDFMDIVSNEDHFIEQYFVKTIQKETEKSVNTAVQQMNGNSSPINGSSKEIPLLSKTNKAKDKPQIEFPEDRQNDPVVHVKTDLLMKLKTSTRKLICLLEEIESKTHSKYLSHGMENLTELIGPIQDTKDNEEPSLTDIGVQALKTLEVQANTLDAIEVEEDEEDDCSVYKRLTRKCLCLNQPEYNDFIIHFNEESKFLTNNTGEIIKNMRIMKKFLYMGGDYTRHALTFLIEGLSSSKHSEKSEIAQGCSHADLCNIFEEHSIVIVFISWPCKFVCCGDSILQALTAKFLYRLAQLEEGRRYLNYTSKISNDIKKVIRKNSSHFEEQTLQCLNCILALISPPIAQFITSTTAQYCKAVEEGFGFKTLQALVKYRHYMTLEEVNTHLEILHNLSKNDNGKRELRKSLLTIFSLFKSLLIEYDNSEMNIILTNILNNIISRSIFTKNNELPKVFVIADTGTEAIVMKDEAIQIQVKKFNKRIVSKMFVRDTKLKETSKQQVRPVSQPSLPPRQTKNIFSTAQRSRKGFRKSSQRI